MKERKHGESKTRLYNIWKGMKSRCNNPKCTNYPHYGARGIRVCEEWECDYLSFRAWAIGAGYDDTLSIDRIDPNGHYCPDNCRWSTHEVQDRNKTNNIFAEINGEKHTLSDWAEIAGIKKITIFKRYYRGDRGENLIRKVEKK